LRRKNLQCILARQSGMVGEIDLAHTARAKEPKDCVAGEGAPS
jgi:hypothetical protein